MVSGGAPLPSGGCLDDQCKIVILKSRFGLVSGPNLLPCSVVRYRIKLTLVRIIPSYIFICRSTIML